MIMVLRYFKLGLLALLLVVSFSNCHMFKNAERERNTHRKAENFDAFYNRFHEDMDFQMTRVRFPLEGLNVEGEKTTKWSKENYVFMKVRVQDIDNKLYHIDTEKTPESFIQKVSLPNSGFYSEYRFKLIDNRWYLVYVMDQNL